MSVFKKLIETRELQKVVEVGSVLVNVKNVSFFYNGALCKSEGDVICHELNKAWDLQDDVFRLQVGHIEGKRNTEHKTGTIIIIVYAAGKKSTFYIKKVSLARTKKMFNL